MVQDEVVVPVVDDQHPAGLDHLEEVVDCFLVLLELEVAFIIKYFVFIYKYK